jgi:hypothetical protein
VQIRLSYHTLAGDNRHPVTVGRKILDYKIRAVVHQPSYLRTVDIKICGKPAVAAVYALYRFFG